MDIDNGRKSNDKKDNKPSSSKSTEDNKNSIDPKKPPRKGTASKGSSKRYNPRRASVKMPMPDLQSDKGESFAGGVVELEPDMPDLVEATIPDTIHEARTVNGFQNSAQPVYSNRVEVRPFLPLPEPIILIPVHPVHPVYTSGTVEEYQRRWREWYYQMYYPPRYEQRRRHGQGARAEPQQQNVGDNQNAGNVETQQPPANAEAQVEDQPEVVETQSHPESEENGLKSDNVSTEHQTQDGDTLCGDGKASDVGNKKDSGTPKDQQKQKNSKVIKKSVTFQDEQPPRKSAEKQTQQKCTDGDDTKKSATDSAKNKKSKKRAQKHRKGKKHV